MRSYLPYFASPLSCHPWLVRFSCSALSGLPSARIRHKGANPRYPDFRPRSVSTAYWPCLLLQPFATTMALTPAARHLGLQVSPLISPHLPGIPPPTTLCAPVSLYTPSPAYRTYFGLRLGRRGSSPHTAESSSSSCGLPVRLQLLSTPPHGDAVTFGYRALAYPDTDFHCANVAPSRAHSSREGGDPAATQVSAAVNWIPAFAGMTDFWCLRQTYNKKNSPQPPNNMRKQLCIS